MKNYNYSFIITLFLIFQTNFIFAQNQQKIDSLQQLLNATSSDSIKVQLYGKLSWIYINTRVKTPLARQYADSIKWIAQESNNQYAFSRYHFYTGVIDRIENNHAAGIKHFEAYINYHKTQGDSTRVARGLYHLAIIHKTMGNYEKSLSSQYRVLKIQEKEPDDFSAATTRHAIGTLFFEIKKYDEAIKFYNKSLEGFRNLNDQEHIAMVCVSLGNLYVKLHQSEEASHYYQKGLKLYEELNNTWGVALALANIGFMYDEQQAYQLALKYHLKALELRKTMPNKEFLTRSLIAVGRGYLALENNDLAESYLKKAALQAEEIKAKSLKRDIEFHLAKIYAVKKNYYKAYTAQKLYSEINDSLLNENLLQKMSDLKTKYETAQRDKEIELLTKENKLQAAKSEKETTLRKTLMVGFTLLMIIAALLFYNMWQRLRNQKKLISKNEEIERSHYREQLQTLEMKALRAQMNPHFLFNCLNSINTMIMNDENENASKYLSKFSKLVRLLLENSEQPSVSLKDELTMLESYVQLEALRFNNRIDYKIEVAKQIDQDSTYIPSMVLQPFVENAIWHGLLHKDNKGLLTIVIIDENSTLRCSIIDNGIGREESLLLQKEGGLKKKSMGIKITTERLRLLTKQKIEEVISIVDLKDSNNIALGTQVNLNIPIS